MEISSLIKKIGHSLVEIRVRALRSILCKLEHSLLSVSDLVQERMLFVLLLEWFNFPDVPMQEEVLQLLSSLSKHPTAAQMLRDIGAVEFFTQLSASVEPSFQAIIDGILDRLFQLPDLLPTRPTSHSLEQSVITSTVPPEQERTEGYFQSSRPSQEDLPPQRIAVSKSVRCLKFCTFPWLTLTTTDRHILSSNESSLRSNNVNLVQTTCELLRDVIMQDFPAEIFLQRPSIVQGLLALLRPGTGEGGAPSHLRLQAVACLRQLCAALRRRLRFHRDPGFCSAKQDPVSQNSSLSYSQEARGAQAQRSLASSPGAECSPRPSVVGRTGQRPRGDGQDGDAASNSGSSHGGGGAAQAPRQTAQSPADAAQLELADLGAEDLLELQLQQLSLAQFTVATMEHAILLLRTDAVRVFQRVLELLYDALLLLGDSVCEQVWEDHSLVGMELREKLRGGVAALGEVLSHHQDCSTSAAGRPGALLHHRMAYVGTAVFTVRLLQTVLPLEKASENLPESTATAIFLLSLDKSFGLAYPSMQEAAVAYLEQVNSDGHALYRRVTRAALWMESTCSFLKEAQAQGEKNWLELLEMADQAIDGLPYHQHLPVVKECIHICSYLWRSEQASPLLKTESQAALLKLLSHPLVPVKTETYTRTLSIVKECLGVQNVSRPVSSVCSGVHFLLHPRVLYQLSTFGLQDPAEKVNAAAKDILLFLMNGRLMMTASTWSRFNEALHPVIPILQSYAGTEDALGKCVLLISEVSNQERNTFPNSAKLKAALRLLFAKEQTGRRAAAKQLLNHLSSLEGAESGQPWLDGPALSALPSLYCLRHTLDVTLDSSDRSLLKVESVEKLFGILTSDSVDPSLRRSAAEQLAIVLQDTAMHPVLKSLGAADRVISFIDGGVSGTAECLDGLLEPCVCMLRKLVYADPSLRHSLAQRTPFLLTLLRASLLVQENGGDVGQAAALMCLLLFDEVATVESWSDKDNAASLSPFSLPVSVIRRYSLPFQAASHHAVSPYCTVLAPPSELLSLPAARHALQLAWNAAWHSGIDNLLEEHRGLRSDVPDFHDDLSLSEAQLLSLRVTHLPAGLGDCVQAIVTAAGHGSVTSALSRLRLYLLVDRLAHAPGRCADALRSLAWQPAMTRFLQVRPACVEDERLLVDMVAFLNAYFKPPRLLESESEDKDLRWIVELLLQQETSSLLDPLLGAESQPHSQTTQAEPEAMSTQVTQRLQRELASFFSTLLHHLRYTPDRLCLALAGPFRSQLALRLLRGLRVSDAPRFYGLPSLERTLLGMVSLTARPGWSSHCPSLEPAALCRKYLSGLLEVISSFYVEWGGNSMSFMGKGVTKNTVVCLLHLSHEMMAEAKDKDKDFISQWSLGQEAGSEEPSGTQLGLSWLIPLWVDRDPEVRCASLGVGAALSSVPSGCQALCASCQNISGGLWGTLLSILLDPQESSLVRREAAFILQNLLVMPMPADADEARDSSWQNPCVHDEASGVSLVGLPALQALLYHCQFFQHLSLMASSCYRGRYAFPLQPAPAPDSGPQDEVEAEDSLNLWASSCPPAPSRSVSRASGSLSTSSTLIFPGGSRPHSPVDPSPLGPAQDTPASRLMAQGQSDTDTSDSLISQDSRPGDPAAEACVIVTPDLPSALCGLLANLLAILPDFTLSALRESQLLQSLASVVDAGAIERCLSELRTVDTPPGDREDIKSQVLTLLQYLSSYSRLLQSCVMLSQELIGQMDFLKPLLANVFTVLTLNSGHLDCGTRAAVFVCWTDVLTLLATLVRRDACVAYPSVSTALGRHWQAFSDTLAVCVDRAEPLHTAALQFLCVLLSETAKRRSLPGVTVTPPSPAPATTLAAALDGAPGCRLCELLLQSLEKRPPHDPLKTLTAQALMALLACSPPAQDHAAKAGLIDSCVEQMKQSQSQLNLESIRPGRASHRRKEESYVREVKMAVEIMRNCLYRNDSCKAVATDARLAPVLHTLWPWLLLDDPAMEAALELLCVYTANCTAACSSLCSGVGGAPGPRGGPGSSLMHCVMKLASGVAPDNSAVQKLSFSLLANLAVCRDCRGVLHKSNFLQAFLAVPVPKAGGGGGGGGGALLGLWLRLLVGLTSGEDGQQSLLRVGGALELLADAARQRRRHALLVLHNLCFCSANKPRLLANDKALQVLLWSLESKDTEVCSIGASALWALLHNYQKAKTTLKSPSVRLRVDEAYSTAQKDAEKKHDPMNTYLLKCLENLRQLLNN